MTDYSKPETVSLSDLKIRIHSTDLVPSRAGLLEDIDAIFDKLSQRGIVTWMDLQTAIKNPKHIEAFSIETGIALEYLVLLRREVEGYHPKPFAMKEIDWVPQEVLSKLTENGISNSEALLSRNSDNEWQPAFREKTGIDQNSLGYLIKLAELCRVQWVSPTTARMLIEAGYDHSHKLSTANADELFKALDSVNVNGRYFKGTIGLRDIKRLIEAAKYFA